MKVNKTHDGQIIKSINVTDDEITIGDLLKSKTNLSMEKIKKMLTFGGVWHFKKSQKKGLRIKRVKKIIYAGDKVEVYYDSKINYNEKTSTFKSLEEGKNYGVYFKESGQLISGTPFGDRGTLFEHLEKQNKTPFIVHRLDRETAGLVLVAYNKKAANFLSILFQENKIEKKYKAWVKGKKIPLGIRVTWNKDLLGKKSITHVEAKKYSQECTLLDIELETGRTHQIRKHANLENSPVMGDPKYGKGNKDIIGLSLIAYRLKFINPFSKKETIYEIDTSEFEQRY